MSMRNTLFRIPRPALFPVLLLAVMAGSVKPGLCQQDEGSIRFEVTFPASVRNEAVTGRIFVILSDRDDPEPRLQVSCRSTPRRPS